MQRTKAGNEESRKWASQLSYPVPFSHLPVPFQPLGALGSCFTPALFLTEDKPWEKKKKTKKM